jgi:hypothetical protein
MGSDIGARTNENGARKEITLARNLVSGITVQLDTVK